MAETLIDVDIATGDGTPSVDLIERWVRRALDASGAAPADPVEVAVRVVGEREMQNLNRDYRGKDQPTNVLAFPAGDGPVVSSTEARVLGDIAICAPIVAAEAKAQGKPADDHWAHLVVHGTLHLLGFDHVDERDAAEMEATETLILTDHGVPDPYRAQ